MANEMREGRLSPFGANEMRLFANETPDLVYNNVEKVLSKLKETARTAHGVDLVFGVVSNAWAPMLRSTRLVESGLIEFVEAQEFVTARTAQGQEIVTGPLTDVSALTKPAALHRLSKKGGVPFQCMAYVGNGFSDEHAMRELFWRGGISIGTYELDERGRQDEIQLRALKRDGVLKTLTRSLFTSGDGGTRAFSILDKTVSSLASRVKFLSVFGAQTPDVAPEHVLSEYVPNMDVWQARSGLA